MSRSRLLSCIDYLYFIAFIALFRAFTFDSAGQREKGRKWGVKKGERIFLPNHRRFPQGLFRIFFAVSPVISVHSEVRLGLGLRPGLRPDFAITTNAAEQEQTG